MVCKKSKPGISLCMIVKNEGETIDRAISSALLLFDQMVVLVDSSTTDDTLDKANRLRMKGDIVTKFIWSDDFSKARNLALKYCTRDWVFILDGHEYLENADRLRKAWEETKKEIDIYLLPVRDLEIDPSSLQYQVRLFRNNGDLKFVNALHNQLAAKNENGKYWAEEVRKKRLRYVADIMINHKRPEKLQEERSIQRDSMLENIFKKRTSNPNEVHALYYIAGHHYRAEEYGLAFDYFMKCAFAASDPYLRYQCFIYLGLIQEKEGSRIAARRFYFDAAQIKECELLPVAYLHIGQHYLESGGIENSKIALEWFNFAKDRQFPLTGIPMPEDHFTWMPDYKLAEAYGHLANAHLKRSLKTENEEDVIAADKYLNTGFDLCSKCRLDYEDQQEISENFQKLGDKYLKILETLKGDEAAA